MGNCLSSKKKSTDSSNTDAKGEQTQEDFTPIDKDPSGGSKSATVENKEEGNERGSKYKDNKSNSEK